MYWNAADSQLHLGLDLLLLLCSNLRLLILGSETGTAVQIFCRLTDLEPFRTDDGLQSKPFEILHNEDFAANHAKDQLCQPASDWCFLSLCSHHKGRSTGPETVLKPAVVT